MNFFFLVGNILQRERQILPLEQRADVSPVHYKSLGISKLMVPLL